MRRYLELIRYFVYVLQTNSHLKVLRVSHNRIGGSGGFDLGRAIGKILIPYIYHPLKE